MTWPDCRLVEAVLAGSFLDELPTRLIGGIAYDLDTLDEKRASNPTADVEARPRVGES
jgi:hypothetical protein